MTEFGYGSKGELNADQCGSGTLEKIFRLRTQIQGELNADQCESGF
jgi:hypothetical protein